MNADDDLDDLFDELDDLELDAPAGAWEVAARLERGRPTGRALLSPNGRMVALVTRDGARLDRRWGRAADTSAPVFLRWPELRALDIACRAWARDRHGWAPVRTISYRGPFVPIEDPTEDRGTSRPLALPLEVGPGVDGELRERPRWRPRGPCLSDLRRGRAERLARGREPHGPRPDGALARARGRAVHRGARGGGPGGCLVKPRAARSPGSPRASPPGPGERGEATTRRGPCLLPRARTAGLEDPREGRATDPRAGPRARAGLREDHRVERVDAARAVREAVAPATGAVPARALREPRRRASVPRG